MESFLPAANLHKNTHLKFIRRQFYSMQKYLSDRKNVRGNVGGTMWRGTVTDRLTTAA